MIRALIILMLAGLLQAPAWAGPALAGRDVLDGRRIELQQYRHQTVLLVFFRAGCASCVYNFKLLREFYKANRNSQFAVIGVGLDKEPAVFRDYARLVAATTPAAEQFPLLWRLDPAHRDGFGEMRHDSSVLVIGKEGEILLRREGVIKNEGWDEIWTYLRHG
ncbi:TlpA family protein disulfide reductase [Chitinilyticum aquatile]|uniref:TlpA family protein disulfide reductase n=1 Tax=Chitinilyticum aquatile TaxID=362520 RepID=UPI000401635C|nr:redoxin domain-containing protein [Chitinilyticum aquatile]